MQIFPLKLTTKRSKMKFLQREIAVLDTFLHFYAPSLSLPNWHNQRWHDANGSPLRHRQITTQITAPLFFRTQIHRAYPERQRYSPCICEACCMHMLQKGLTIREMFH